MTSTASPSPSDMTTEGVSAPGRCRLAIAMRHATDRARGALRAIRHRGPGDQAQRDERERGRDDDDDRDGPLRTG